MSVNTTNGNILFCVEVPIPEEEKILVVISFFVKLQLVT